MTFFGELKIYVGRMREFERVDWFVYCFWVGLIGSLAVVSASFLLLGNANGVSFPSEAWFLPSGSFLFALSIAIDTVGHRTIYKQEIARAEGLVHGITIFCGIGSSVLLTAAYSERDALWIPALVLTVLSFVYSLVDEAFHWRRYVRQSSDRIEMWSHVGILTGHATMMAGWWAWFAKGYSGVHETLGLLGIGA